MNIKVLMENTPFEDGFLSEHGLSLYIETKKHKILFDTGQSDNFAVNAERIGADLAAADIAVISHGHYDHGGGLERFLAINDKAPVYISQHAFEPYFNVVDKDIGLKPELKNIERMILVGEQLKIDDELELFACNNLPRKYYMDSYGLKALRGEEKIPDDFIHEQYLLIKEGDKRVLISGCSHKGILNIMHWIKPDVLIGGFHFMKIDPQGKERFVLDEAADNLMNYNTDYYTCHCTGIEQYEYLKKLMGDKLNYLSSGQEINI